MGSARWGSTTAIFSFVYQWFVLPNWRINRGWQRKSSTIGMLNAFYFYGMPWRKYECVFNLSNDTDESVTNLPRRRRPLHSQPRLGWRKTRAMSLQLGAHEIRHIRCQWSTSPVTQGDTRWSWDFEMRCFIIPINAASRPDSRYAYTSAKRFWKRSYWAFSVCLLNLLPTRRILQSQDSELK